MLIRLAVSSVRKGFSSATATPPSDLRISDPAGTSIAKIFGSTLYIIDLHLHR